MTRLLTHMRHNAVAWLALFISLGGTGAYAANTITSADIVDETIQSQDIKNGQVRAADIRENNVTSSRIADGSVSTIDLRDGAVTSAKLAPLDALRLTSDLDGDRGVTFGDSALRLRQEGTSSLRLNGSLGIEQRLRFGFAGSGQTRSEVGRTFFENRQALQLDQATRNADDSTTYTTIARFFGAAPRHRVGTAGEPPFIPSTPGGCGAQTHFNNGADGHVEFYRDDNEMTHLSGLVSGAQSGCVIFTLPAGFRPCVRQIQPAVSNNAFARVTIELNGNVTAGPGTQTNWLSLNGISFQNNSLFC
jgi:hypothetical protein